MTKLLLLASCYKLLPCLANVAGSEAHDRQQNYSDLNSSPQSADSRTHGFAEAHGVNLKIIWGISTTINKHVHFLNKKGMLLIEIKKLWICLQRLSLAPTTIFQWSHASISSKKVLFTFRGADFKQPSEINQPRAIEVALTGVRPGGGRVYQHEGCLTMEIHCNQVERGTWCKTLIIS